MRKGGVKMKGRIVVLDKGVEKKSMVNAGCCKPGIAQNKV